MAFLEQRFITEMNEERGKNPVSCHFSGNISKLCRSSLEWLFTSFKKMFDAILGRCVGTPSLQTTITEVRNIYMIWQQVISLVSLLRPQRFFCSLLDSSLNRLFNILRWLHRSRGDSGQLRWSRTDKRCYFWCSCGWRNSRVRKSIGDLKIFQKRKSRECHFSHIKDTKRSGLRKMPCIRM